MQDGPPRRSPPAPAPVQSLAEELAAIPPVADRNTGGNVNYYVLRIDHPKRPEHAPCTVECEDIIEALGMTFAEGCAFKALWRRCAAKKLGVMKKGYDGPAYDGEKTAYYAQRMVAQDKLEALAHQIVGLTESSTGLDVDHTSFYRK